MKLTREDMLLCIDLITDQRMSTTEVAEYKEYLRNGLDASEELINKHIREMDAKAYDWLHSKLRRGHGSVNYVKLDGMSLHTALRCYETAIRTVRQVTEDVLKCNKQGVTSLWNLKLRTSLRNSLSRAGIRCIEDLDFLREDNGYSKLRRMRGLGQTSAEELIDEWSSFHNCSVAPSIQTYINNAKNKQITLDQALQKIAAGYSTGELQLQQYATQDNYKALRAFLGLSENTNANSALEFLDSMEV